MYKVIYADVVEKDLRKLDKNIVRKILYRIEHYLCRNPQELGKRLTGDYAGYWRYRWDDYRVIYRLSDSELLVVVLRISHRKSAY